MEETKANGPERSTETTERTTVDTLLPLLLVPILGGLLASLFNRTSGSRWERRALNWLEYAVLIVLISGVMSVGWFISRGHQFSSNEWLSGSIVVKNHEDVSCDHCRDVCDKRDKDGHCTSSHKECDHSFDRKWFALTDYNFDGHGRIDFPTTDRQGLRTPKRWTQVRIGEPATSVHPFKSYLKPNGEADSFPMPSDIRKQYEKYVPPYPTEFAYDYYHGAKVFALGYGDRPPNGFQLMKFEDVKGRWSVNSSLNNQLEALNARLGPKKQANIQLYRVNAQAIPDQRFADLALSIWRGGGKNDIGVWIATNGDEISWVRITLGATTMGNEMFVVNLRDALYDLPTFDNNRVLETIEQRVSAEFNRKAMKDFENRKAGVHPSTLALVILYMVAIIITVVGIMIFYNNDPFGIDERHSHV